MLCKSKSLSLKNTEQNDVKSIVKKNLLTLKNFNIKKTIIEYLV